VNQLHGILFAYRTDRQLRELVEHRTTASIPFAGRYRFIDFMLSNLINAGVTDVGVVMRESYQSLLDHLGSGKDWDLSRKHGGLKLLPPFSFARARGGGAYRGKLEALAGVYDYLKSIRQDYVLLADGDLVANLPVREIFDAHLKSGADITAVCAAGYHGESAVSTYFLQKKDGSLDRVLCGTETPVGLEALEVYILSRDLLLSLVDEGTARGMNTFGRFVLQERAGSLSIQTWRFDGYVARIRTPSAYFARSMDLMRPEVRASLFDRARPIRTRDRSDPSSNYAPGALVRTSLVADGCILEGTVENAILFRGVRVAPGAVVKNSIVMQDSVIGKGAVLDGVIADKDVTVHEGRRLAGHPSYPLVLAKGSVI